MFDLALNTAVFYKNILVIFILKCCDIIKIVLKQFLV